MIPPQNDDLFDDDPIENLKIENDILKLKMQAEHGAHFFTDHEIPPEVEALFLRNVNEFEKAWENAVMVSIYNFLGQPALEPYDQLTSGEMDKATTRLLSLLTAKNIHIEKPSSIEPLVFYRFLTEELMKQEIEDMQMEGFFRCFDYYEFHPDHQRDIKACAERFLDNWFRKNVEGLKWDLNKKIALAEGPILSNDHAMEKINEYFDSFSVLSGGHFQIHETRFQWDDLTGTGTGHCGGMLYYETESFISESKKYGGSFTIYLSNDFGYWNIVYFDIPGFNLTN